MTLTDIITIITGLVGLFIPILLIGLAFVWNIFMLISAAGDAKQHQQARARLIWSIIAVFVFFTLIGILTVLRGTFFGSNANPTIPLGDLESGIILLP